VSYDILFVPRRPGQSWDQALDDAEGRDVLGDAIGPQRMEQWGRIVEALRRRLGEVDVRVDDDVCEATHASGLQVSLYPDEASITFPYSERPDRRAFHDDVVDVVGILERETGLQAWDAQTDGPFDGHVHDEAGLAATRRIGQETSDVARTDAMADRAAAGHIGPDTGPVDLTVVGTAGTARTPGAAAGAGTPLDAEDDRARQRRRGLRYIVVGVVVVVAAFLLGRQGGSSTLSSLALVLGVADVVVGCLLYRRSRRPAPSAGPAVTGPAGG
jgi:hypothetical protein